MRGADETHVALLDAALFDSRFELVRPLRTGNGVNTYLAVDSDSSEAVVVKTIDRALVPQGVRIRFEHETAVLRRLSGLGLGRLIDAGQTGDRLFLVQEFLPGQTLAKLLDGGPLPVATAMRIGRDVAAALDIAHSASICHRDVKPANVIVRSGAGIESVTLIDFGFARSPKLDESIRDELVGTVRYLAPEAAGLLPSPTDERSDLYSLGVVLFECLAGRPVFIGDTVGDLLRHHLSTPAPELRSLGIAVPRAVDDVIQRLLRKEPAERYQSAAALAADLDDLTRALEAGQIEPRLVVGRRDRRSTLTDPSFIGRHDEVAELGDAISQLCEGTGGIITLHADSGGGKSRLLNEVSRIADEAGVVVLHGQGVAQAAQRPYTLLHGVGDGLVNLFADDPVGREALRTSLRDQAVAIVRALPSMSELLDSPAELDTGPEQFGEIRSLVGLRALLTTVATPERPVLIVLDDCQWADMLTVRLLNELFPRTTANTYLTVIAAFRSEEVPAFHALRELRGSRDIHLGPLPPDELAMLAESMAGPLPTAALETVVRLAGGNPFMGAAVMRGLVESGALTATDAGWVVDEEKIQDVQAARQSALFLVSRLELLSPSALALLSAGAVLGKHFDVARAVDIADADAMEAAEIVADASHRRLLWIESDGQCRFFHDKIREALLDRLRDDVSAALHSRAADALIHSRDRAPVDDDTVFDIAYHLDAAGRGLESLPHAIVAANLSRSRYALDAAVSYYRMAARVSAHSEVSLRADIAEGLGDVLTLQGVYTEAEASLRQARELVTDRTRGAELEGKLGALAFKQGDIPNAKQHLEGAVARLGRRIPRHTVTQLVWVVWELLVQLTHTAAPRLLLARRSNDGHEDDFLAMRLYSRLAYLYWFHSGKIPCAWTHLRGMNLAERYQQSPELGQAYSEHAPVMTMLPWYARGIRYAQRSHEIRLAQGDIWGQGQSRGFTGVVQYAASQFEPASVACTQAIELLTRTGDQWEVNTATWNLALCHLRTGELRQAMRVASDLFASASRIGDQTSAGIALSVWTRAVLGRVDRDLITAQLAKVGEDVQTKAELLLADALYLRQSGDLTEAAEAIRQGIDLVRGAGLRQEYVAPLFAWQTTILRELAESTSAYTSDARRARLRESIQAGRRARRWARAYRNNAPHALRELGLLAALQGRSRRARLLLRRSLSEAEKQGAQFERAQSLLALEQVTKDTPVDERRANVEWYQAEVDAFLDESTSPMLRDSEPTISLFDRFASLLTVGRAITAATSFGALEEAIREATVSLVRPERCHLVPVGALLHDPLTTDSGANLHAASRSLLAEAVESGSTVVAIGDADPNESLLLSGVRSALAAPIRVQGEVVSCIYATHRQIGELFGDDEIQLADFIATIAGAAFEHLLGNESRFRSLAQNSSDVITLVNSKGVVTYQSPAVKRVFGQPAEEILSEPIATWLHPDDVPDFEAAIAAAAPGSDARLEHRVRHADGTYREAETMLTNLLDEPTVGAVVLNTRDVTDRKQVEERLREQNIDLERASRAKDMFLATMSHELRTPLNAIIGFTGVLLMELPGPLNPDQARQLRTVEQSGRHLLTIINDILDMTKIESGAVQVQMEQVDCQAAVDHVVSTLAPLATEKGLELRTTQVGEGITARGDARAIGQILMNLVGNAVKFTDAGSVSIGMTESADQIAITVADTGSGIAEADLRSIFEAFEQGTSTTHARKEGTGLGLYVSHKLAELIGASLDVQSTVGVGTTFTLRLEPWR